MIDLTNALASDWRDKLQLNEQYIYGSARVGMLNRAAYVSKCFTTGDHMSAQDGYQAFGSTSYVVSSLVYSHEMSSNDILPYEKSVIFVSRKTYEFSDHLGNVSATISDRKITIVVSAGNAVASYAPEVLSQQDYFPFFAALSICDSEWLAMRTQSEVVNDVVIPFGFTSNLYHRVEVGMALAERTVTGTSTEGYRYGFNGQEKESDITGTASHTSAEFWMYDSRLGRRWEVDPMSAQRPGWAPYHAMSNSPISRHDPLGNLDDWVITESNETVYDSRVVDEKTAKQFYGEKAQYLAFGEFICDREGNEIELGEYGFFKENGEIFITADLGEIAYNEEKENDKQAIAACAAAMVLPRRIIQVQMMDLVTPEATDVIPIKWLGHAVLFTLATATIAKMTSEIAAIEAKSAGPMGTLYQLEAILPGPYPVYIWGSKVPSPVPMILEEKDVWKYGETTSTNPEDRYDDNYLRSIGSGVKFQPIWTGTQREIKIQEKIMIYGYFLNHGHLPPGNKIFR